MKGKALKSLFSYQSKYFKTMLLVKRQKRINYSLPSLYLQIGTLLKTFASCLSIKAKIPQK